MKKTSNPAGTPSWAAHTELLRALNERVVRHRSVALESGSRTHAYVIQDYYLDSDGEYGATLYEPEVEVWVNGSLVNGALKDLREVRALAASLLAAADVLEGVQEGRSVTLRDSPEGSAL